MAKLKELQTTSKAFAYNHPEPITKPQLNKLLITIEALTKNRNERLRFVSLCIGRTVLSFKELKKGEAMALLDDDLTDLYTQVKKKIEVAATNSDGDSEWGVIKSESTNEAPEDRERKILRLRAINDRRLKRGHTRCDYCDTREGSEYHEIIPRSHLPTNSPYRALIYQTEICSWTCHECHMNIAPTAIGRIQGLVSLCRLYGYFRVYAAFMKVPERFRYGINFPEYSEVKGE